MADTFKIPNGYEITVLRRQDVIKCIDDNIIDKEIALAIVEKCEKAAANLLREGKWVGIPYLGNIRIPKGRLKEESPEQQALIDEAKNLLSPNDYIIFRKQLYAENAKEIKYTRYYKYMLSIAINKNRDLYKKLCVEKGDLFARIFIFSLNNITAVDNEYVILEQK